ncbi:hypothetical protein AB205_0091530 [Aquarana catesbeiana]|uniref:Uncharacterized protein n=1 Tax=Aquarana catesbeiana TaxID=8400 RepID=A0A2G9RH14_AQUCT|nr:hypothetical protein AB205_0091530 [Aquarana catesbeiana]
MLALEDAFSRTLQLMDYSVSLQPGMINQLLAAADERPWLWGLYLLTAALPVGLLILFCWPRKKIEEEEDADFSMSDFIESDENDFELQKDLTKENQQNLEGATSETQYDKEAEEDERMEDEEFSQEEEEIGDIVDQSSDDEMKEADEGADSGDNLKKSLRKRRVRKD